MAWLLNLLSIMFRAVTSYGVTFAEQQAAIDSRSAWCSVARWSASQNRCVPVSVDELKRELFFFPTCRAVDGTAASSHERGITNV